MVLQSPSKSPLADLSAVPQTHETTEQRDARMQWFRDAKFGMFIHWGPCSVGQREIGWGREANKPWDIFGPQTPRTADPEYDNYYKQFNPVKYDADAWVRFAKASGMKYMVLIAKHHDGFSQFDTKLSNYSIMASPYGKDIIKPFVEACHRHGMKAGIYYSTRDWYHPDYLVGDNAKYDAWYRGQVEELLSHYGKVDLMWFDHVGGKDWGKWRFDELFAMMYRLQPGLLVNDRAAKLCGPKTPEDRGPATPELENIVKGDFDTPENQIGAMDLSQDWESCIHVGEGWSYRGEDGFKGPEDSIKMLVSCTTGGGNLLLNFGPRPDGTFAEGEAKVARALGEWLQKYGEAIYGTRGGPIRNGLWGGSCHKGNQLFLHVYDWPTSQLTFDPLPFKVQSARTLTGAPVEVTQTATTFSVKVAEPHRDTPVTVIELTLDQPVPEGQVIAEIRSAEDKMAPYGGLLNATEKWESSSGSVQIDLAGIKEVKAVVIEAREGENPGLILSVSENGNQWEEIGQAKKWEEKWLVLVTHFHAGIDMPGRPARYLKLEARGEKTGPLRLQRVEVHGTEKAS